MGLLDEIFIRREKENSISSGINRKVEAINRRRSDCEEELSLRQQAGQNVELWCVNASRERGLPYDCFFEWEVSMVEEAKNANDNLKGTLRLLTCAQDYQINNKDLEETNPLRQFNNRHTIYWIDKLCEKAKNGSLYACTAVTSPYFVIVENPIIENRILDFFDNNTRELYVQIIMDEMNKNNPHAILGYAFFQLFGDDVKNNERKKLFKKAGELGLSEAYDQLFFMTKDCWNSTEGFEIAVAAAECNDGEKAYEYQDKLGDAYWYAESWVKTQDRKKALYWYQRAADNGNRSAQLTLKMLTEKGEI